jgi:putative ABC transport system permease protein
MVRTNGVPSSLAPAVRQAVWSLDRDVPIDRVGPLEAVVATSLGQPRLLMVLLGVFGSLAVALGAIGIYGVISYGVAQRTQEIGVRLALGAGRRDVVRLVVGHALALCVTGLVIGIALALALTRVLTRQLYGIEATDPITFVGMGTLLCVVAVAASWIPALRASRVDPTVSLRAG